MTEHFTKNTVQAKLWCKRCFRYTMHRIDSGRKGPCLDCMDRRGVDVKKAALPPAEEQLKLKF